MNTRWYPSIENEISKNAFEPVRLKLSPVCSDLNMWPFCASLSSKRCFNYLKRSRQQQFLLERFSITFTANERSQLYRVTKFSLYLKRCFHSRGQHICKFIGTKESVCIRKGCNSQRTGLGHQHGRRFIVLGHQYGRRDVMWKHSIVATLHLFNASCKIMQHILLPIFLVFISSPRGIISFNISVF